MVIELVWTADPIGPRTVLRFRFDAGRLIAATLEEPGLTHSYLQRFAWRRWITTARAAALRMHGLLDYPSPERRRRQPGIPGPMPRADDYFIQIAGDYAALQASGEAAPTRRLAERHGINRNTMAGHVRQARLRGFLPATR